MVVAQEGSFQRASARLNIAQPALSRQIRNLEDELGFPLLVRLSTGVQLTAAGEVLLAEVEQLLRRVEFAKRKTERAAMGQFGHVRISFTGMVAETLPAVAAFAKVQRLIPDVEFGLDLADSEKQIELIHRGEVDVAVSYRHRPHPIELSHLEIRTENYKLLVSNGHPLTSNVQIKLSDLRDYDMVFPHRLVKPGGYSELVIACLRGNYVPKVSFESYNETMAVNFVSQGLAIAFCLPSMAERRVVSGVTFLDVVDLDCPLSLTAMWEKQKETPAVMEFIRVLSRYCDGPSFANCMLDEYAADLLVEAGYPALSE